MRRKRYRRRSRIGKISAGKLLLVLLAVSCLGALISVSGVPLGGEPTAATLGKHYVERALPLSAQTSPSRGGEAPRSHPDQDQSLSQKGEELTVGLFHQMIGAVLPAVGVDPSEVDKTSKPSDSKEKQTAEKQDGEKAGDQLVPSGDSSTEQAKADQPAKTEKAPPQQDAEKQQEKAEAPQQNTAFVPDPNLPPQVIIYHTHATESYMPVEEGNFHSLNENGTVREVGDAMAAALQAKGIGVIHDKTVHDSPSYNQSYGRSLQTIKKLIAKNPSVKIVIDLHRDAAGAGGGPVKTVQIAGQTAACFSLVVGKGNPNYQKLNAFANQIISLTNQIHPSLAGKVIQKEYKYNQYVSDHHLLLEIGNNQNNIQQAKVTGKYFADVLAAALKNM